MYVDDFALFASGCTRHAIERQTAVSKHENRIAIPRLCPLMFVQQQRLTLHNSPVANIYKYLGVIFDRNVETAYYTLEREMEK